MRRSVNDYDKSSGGGGYTVNRTRSKNPDQEAMQNIGLGLGLPAAGAGIVAATNRPKPDTSAADKAKREADAEMKRETRGVQKPANFDAIEEAKQEVKDAKDRKKISDMGYAKGGMTASARADGIASRGKTRGTIIK